MENISRIKQRMCDVCNAFNPQRKLQKTDSKPDHAAEVLKEKRMPCGVQSELLTMVGELPNGLLV